MHSRTKYMSRLIVLLLLALFLLGGCFGSKETAQEPALTAEQLEGKVWRCTMLFEREVFEESEITLEFLPEGKVKGIAGCNSYSGTYTLANSSLRFGPLMSTKKSCGPSLDEQEFTFMTFMAQIDKVVLADDDELELWAPEQGSPMLFTTGSGGLLW